MPTIIATAGSSGSGKTTVNNRLASYYRKKGLSVHVLSVDHYYLGKEAMQAKGIDSFDHPEALDWPLFLNHLASLAEGATIAQPEYCFKQHARTANSRQINGSDLDIILVEGILVNHTEELRQHYNVSIFVDTASPFCRVRRVQRDMQERGRDRLGALLQWEDVAEKDRLYVQPCRTTVNIIVENTSDQNPDNIDLGPLIEAIEAVNTAKSGRQYRINLSKQSSPASHRINTTLHQLCKSYDRILHCNDAQSLQSSMQNAETLEIQLQELKISHRDRNLMEQLSQFGQFSGPSNGRKNSNAGLRTPYSSPATGAVTSDSSTIIPLQL